MKIGLTGGIGAGKSVVAAFFQECGISIIDADVLAHTLMQPNTDCFHIISQHIGSVVCTNGALDKKKMLHWMMHEEKNKMWLENLMHDRIMCLIHMQLKKKFFPYVVVCVPLLYEKNMHTLFDRILLVHAAESIRYQRLQQYRHLSKCEIHTLFSWQYRDAERLEYAQDVLINHSNLEDLKKQVYCMHRDYRCM